RHWATSCALKTEPFCLKIFPKDSPRRGLSECRIHSWRALVGPYQNVKKTSKSATLRHWATSCALKTEPFCLEILPKDSPRRVLSGSSIQFWLILPGSGNNF